MSETRKKMTLPRLYKKVEQGQPITWLTGYDYPTAYLQEQAGVDMILVGDSLGMTMLGYDSTLPVTMDDMVRQVLNFNAGTILLGFLLHRLGIDIEFKISVFFGSDNPYHALWILMMAKLFSRDDGSSPLIGFNWSNAVDNRTMELSADFRKQLGFEDVVRFEHHITETWKSIVRQPYNRRDELMELAEHVANISAKHEGGDPEIDSAREHPSDILDYFREKEEVITSGDWEALKLNFLDKFDAANRTACELTRHRLSFVAARNLHR